MWIMFCMCRCWDIVSTQCPKRAEDGAGSSRTGVADGCVLPHGCCETKLRPLQEQPMLLTTGPSLRSLESFLLSMSNNIRDKLVQREEALKLSSHCSK